VQLPKGMNSELKLKYKWTLEHDNEQNYQSFYIESKKDESKKDESEENELG